MSHRSRAFAVAYVCTQCGWTSPIETVDCPMCQQPTVQEQVQDLTEHTR